MRASVCVTDTQLDGLCGHGVFPRLLAYWLFHFSFYRINCFVFDVVCYTMLVSVSFWVHIKLLCVYLIYLLIVDITGICFDTELGASQLASSATWRDCSLHFAINCLFCRMEVACNKTVFFCGWSRLCWPVCLASCCCIMAFCHPVPVV